MKNDNNLIRLTGDITKDFAFDHEAYNEKFYRSEITVNRLSDNSDVISIIISERVTNSEDIYTGSTVTLEGRIKTINVEVSGKNQLKLYVFVDSLIVDEGAYHQNEVFLTGFIGKHTPVYRTTPLGLQIADFVLCVNRKIRKSDYIPCICWGRNAKYAASFETGYQLITSGRLQSRNYLKDGVSKTAYEVSIGEMEVINGYEEGE